jgi:uncharacterized protein involved in response to NO
MFFVAYDIENTTEERILIGVVATVVAGLLSGRWWITAVPVLFSAALALWVAVTWDSQDTSVEEMFWALVLFALTGVTLMAAGVSLRKIGAAIWRRATRSGPETPGTARSPSPR